VKRILVILLFVAFAFNTLPGGCMLAQLKAATAENLALTPLIKEKVLVRPVPGEVSPRLAVIFGRNGESFPQREQAIASLTQPLTEEEVGAAYAFLQTTAAAYAGPAGAEHVLKNNLINFIGRLTPPPADWLKELCALYHDRNQDGATRDYALQHITDYTQYESGPLAADRPAARAVLWEAVREKGSLAGTALLGLNRVSKVDAEIDGERVSAVALQMATSSGTDELSRITAVQICAQRQLAGVLPTAVKLAQTGDDITLRASAIAALGDLGGQTERKLLLVLKNQDAPALRAAVAGALRRMDHRLVATAAK